MTPLSHAGRRVAVLVFVLSGLPISSALAQIQGYGVAATGGTGGTVCTVTTSAESGAGSFDSCVAKGGNQTIQFAVPLAKVRTTEHLQSNTTIDGCANGMNGVTLDQPGDTDRAIAVEGPMSNVVIRCLRFQGTGKQPGYTTEFDLLGIDGTSGTVSRVSVDRCTFVGATDGALDITGNVQDVTVQWSLLYGTTLDQLIKYDTRQRISLHHNVYTSNGERNPQIKGDARNIDFVSNVIHNNTLSTDGVGNGFDPYGTRLWNANSGSDSPGNITGNFVANAWVGTNASLEIDTDSGASAAGIYLSGNYCSPGTCQSSPAPSPLTVPTANVVTVTPPDQMRTAMLPGVGSPNRTATDQSKIDAVATALPAPSGSYALTVTKAGTGSGTVTSSPSGISCGATCSASYTSGTLVTLSQTPAAGSTFAAWSGACTGTGACQVTVNAAKSVTATFTLSVVASLSINDVSLVEGNSGSKNATFTVTLSAPLATAVTVNYATANGTATAGSDYTAASGTLTFAAGETSKTVPVSITGDTAIENDETFAVNLSGATGATIADAQGVGTIANDDFPALSISDATVNEGNSGTTNAVFTVSLSTTSPQTITVNYATANGTASVGSDYAAQSGNLTFTAGQTSKTITVSVIGDTTAEANETFVVNLTAPSKATLADAQGQGTIANDDVATGSEAVSWVDTVGVSVSGASLTKTAATAWGNAGAASTRALNGNGYVAFTLPSATAYEMVGLSNGDSDQGYADIDFALYPYPGTGQLMVYEKGTYRGSFGAFASGDALGITLESGVVKYYRNGTLLYASTQAPTLPLRVDSSLYTTGAAVQGAVLSGSLVDVAVPAVPPSEPVSWVNAVGVAVSGASLAKTAPTVWGNAGAASSRGLNGDGYVEFTLPTTPGYAMFGLGNGDTDQGYADIDFALYTYPGAGQLLIYEKGTYRGSFGAYAAGDKVRVAVVSGVVNYYRNGTLLYTSTQAAVLPLSVDTSLYSTGAILQATVSGKLTDESVAWVNTVGASATPGSITKTAAVAWGNSGGASSRAVNGNGFVQFTLPATPGYAMFGLSNGNTDQGYADIDFAWYTYPATGQLMVYEKGTFRGSFGAYASGDKLKVAVESGVVKYYRNGALLYTSTQAPTLPLRVDTSLYSTGAALQAVTLGGTLVSVP